MTELAVGRSVGEATVRSAAAGDETAFAQLIEQHNSAMARVAYVIAGDREATLDAVQSAWTIAWQKLSSLRDPNQIESWLVAIAANEARQQWRRRGRTTVVDISAALDRSGAPDPGDNAAVMDLERALQGLGPDDRRFLALRFVAGLDSFEIAKQLGMSPSGVRSRLARLTERLRKELNAGEGSEA